MLNYTIDKLIFLWFKIHLIYIFLGANMNKLLDSKCLKMLIKRPKRKDIISISSLVKMECCTEVQKNVKAI